MGLHRLKTNHSVKSAFVIADAGRTGYTKKYTSNLLPSPHLASQSPHCTATEHKEDL